jgi:hypothetical protein
MLEFALGGLLFDQWWMTLFIDSDPPLGHFDRPLVSPSEWIFWL